MIILILLSLILGGYSLYLIKKLDKETNIDLNNIKNTLKDSRLYLLSELDNKIKSSEESLLNKLKEEENLSIIFITHDLNVVKRFADKVLVMNQGNVIERGTTAEIFSNPKDSYTKRLIESIPEPKEINNVSENC